MKFGEQLLSSVEKHPDWAPYSVQYKRLKSILAAIESTCKILDDDVSRSRVADIAASISGVVKNLEDGFRELLQAVRVGKGCGGLPGAIAPRNSIWCAFWWPHPHFPSAPSSSASDIRVCMCEHTSSRVRGGAGGRGGSGRVGVPILRRLLPCVSFVCLLTFPLTFVLCGT